MSEMNKAIERVRIDFLRFDNVEIDMCTVPQDNAHQF